MQQLLGGLFLVFLLTAVSVSAAKKDEKYVYYWIDDSGKLHITDMKPPGSGATQLLLKPPAKAGSVKPQGSCDPSIRYQSEASFWNKKQAKRRTKALYTCGK